MSALRSILDKYIVKKEGKYSPSETSGKIVNTMADVIGANSIPPHRTDDIFYFKQILKENASKSVEEIHTAILKELHRIIEKNTEKYILRKNKGLWGPFVNRIGKMGENMVAKQLHELLVKKDTPGIVASGIKTYTHLSKNLSKFGIHFTEATCPCAEVGQHDIIMISEEKEKISESEEREKVCIRFIQGD